MFGGPFDGAMKNFTETPAVITEWHYAGGIQYSEQYELRRAEGGKPIYLHAQLSSQQLP